MTPLQACAHPFFNDLRECNQRLPNGRELPPLVNFSDQGKRKNYFIFLTEPDQHL